MNKCPYILVNSNRVYLDLSALKNEEVRLSYDGALSEQCEGCGDDIMGNPTVSSDGAIVKCACGATFRVKGL